MGTNTTESPSDRNTGLSAPPLRNGIVIDNDLSVAITRIDRITGPAALQRGHEACAEITLAFRRVGEWPKSTDRYVSREFALLVFDYRANEYRDEFLLQAWAKTGGWAVEGTPANVESLPVGFTWIGKVSVRITGALLLPRRAARTPPRPTDQDRFPMSITNLTVPDLDFNIPTPMLLSRGAEIQSGRDVRAMLGHLS